MCQAQTNLKRACTVYISDSEKLGSLPELSRINQTLSCLSYNCIKYELKHFFIQFSITIIFICMYSLRYKKIYTTSLYDSITSNIAKTSTLCSQYSA